MQKSGRHGVRARIPRRCAFAAARAFALLLCYLTLAGLAPVVHASMPTPHTNADGTISHAVFPVSQPGMANAPSQPTSGAALDFTARNNQQRRILLGVMAGLLCLAAGYLFSRRKKA